MTKKANFDYNISCNSKKTKKHTSVCVFVIYLTDNDSYMFCVSTFITIYLNLNAHFCCQINHVFFY